jgi:hypothetical protein
VENEQATSSNSTWINRMFNKNKQSSLDEEIKSCKQYFSRAD